MFLHSLSISGFRNLVPQTLHFTDRVTVITGMNGQGKTSLLEAIYLLAHPKSFRTAKNRELIAWNLPPSEKPMSRIEAEISTIHGRQALTVELRSGARKAWLNGKEIETVLGFYGQVKVVIFTPEELQLVKGPPQLRRSFIDRTLAMVDPAFVEAAVHYQRALKNRNALLSLKETRPTLREELLFWDSLLIRQGRNVAAKRMSLAEYLAAHLGNAYSEIAQKATQREKVGFAYESDFVNEAGELRREEELAELFQREAEHDIRYRSTTFGIHRDDFNLSLDTGDGPHSARYTASQGQARTLALSLKMSALVFLKEQTEDDPILLLDDVESELDLTRRHALYALLQSSPSQVLLTGTQALSDLNTIEKQISFWQMKSGRIE